MQCISDPKTYMQTIEQNQDSSQQNASLLYGPGGTFESTITVNGNDYIYNGSSLPSNTTIYATIANGTYNYDVVTHDRFGKSLRLEGGGQVPTVGSNPNVNEPNHGKSYALGIYVHKSGILSTGCITIRADQWDNFISNFAIGQTGTITISRSGNTGTITISR
jgi:hypothetical protein